VTITLCTDYKIFSTGQKICGVGGPKLRPIADKYVRTFAKDLPDLCAKMCNDEQYRCENGDFRLSTTRGYRTARLILCDNYIVYRLQDIQYLLRIFYVVHTHQMRYLEAVSDVMKYATIALSAIDYAQTNVNANKCIVYPQLFEELKALW
jgi:hypothetical protein